MENNNTINAVQVKLIHIAKAQLGLGDEQYREMLSGRYWVHTCKDLSYSEANDLIDHFKTLGFKIVTKRYERKQTAPNIVHLVSEQQMKKIEHLRADIRWHVSDGYTRWLRKYLKKDRIGTEREAQNVIEALKNMKDRQQRAGRETGQALRHDGSWHGGRWQW